MIVDFAGEGGADLRAQAGRRQRNKTPVPPARIPSADRGQDRRAWQIRRASDRAAAAASPSRRMARPGRREARMPATRSIRAGGSSRALAPMGRPRRSSRIRARRSPRPGRERSAAVRNAIAARRSERRSVPAMRRPAPRRRRATGPPGPSPNNRPHGEPHPCLPRWPVRQAGPRRRRRLRPRVAGRSGRAGEAPRIHARLGRPLRRGDRDMHDGPRQRGSRQSVENEFGPGVGGGENDVAARRPEQERRGGGANPRTNGAKAGAAPETSWRIGPFRRRAAAPGWSRAFAAGKPDRVLTSDRNGGFAGTEQEMVQSGRSGAFRGGGATCGGGAAQKTLSLGCHERAPWRRLAARKVDIARHVLKES